jgi:hypothetical protein
MPRVRTEMKTTPPATVAVNCPHCGKHPSDPVIAAPQPEPLPPVKAPPPAAYRVMVGGTFAMGGSMCRVATGDIVRLSAYGRDGLDRMRGRGIVLEPLP